MLAALTSCPGVFAWAIVDRNGVLLTGNAPVELHGLVERAVGAFRIMLAGLERTNPSWTSAFFTVEQSYVVGGRMDDAIVLVLARPLVAVEALAATVAVAIGNSRAELAELIAAAAPQTRGGSRGWSDVDHGDGRFGELDEFDEFDGLASRPDDDAEPLDLDDLEGVTERDLYPHAPDAPGAASIAAIHERMLVLQRRLEETRALQRRLLPTSEVAEHTSADFAAFFRPADICSGDWWSLDRLSDGRTLLMMGDATGHGPAPAMLTAIAKTAGDVTRRLAGGDLGVEGVLSAMNDAVFRSARTELLMTCVASEVFPAGAPGGRRIRVTNAGHVFPLLIRYRSRGRGELREIVARGSPLGSAARADLDTVEVLLEPGDILLWYTDGVIDSENEQFQQFGRKRLVRAFTAERSHNPAAVRGRILTSLNRFRGRRAFTDDVSFAVACIK